MKRKASTFFVLMTLVIFAFNFFGCTTETYMQGKRLYTAHCANCHMEDGVGLEKLIPPLKNSDYLKSNQDAIPCILLHGQNGEVIVNGIKYNQEMPGQKYTSVQITNIINYINHAWENDFGVVNLPTTEKRLLSCKPE